VTHEIRFTRQAQKDVQRLSPKIREKLKDILRNHIAVDPYSGKPLAGELKGYYSVRLTYKDRIVYSINDEKLVVVIVRAKTHYGD
jgi:Txe/YoeB family toxin of toxin-antitoxin system